MKALGNSALGRAADLGPLLIRLGVGTVFAVHGWQKFDGGVSNFADFLGSLNVPAPEVVAWLQIIAEGVGGLLLIIGPGRLSVDAVMGMETATAPVGSHRVEDGGA